MNVNTVPHTAQLLTLLHDIEKTTGSCIITLYEFLYLPHYEFKESNTSCTCYCRNKRLIIQVDEFLNYDGLTDAIKAGLIRIIHMFLKSQSI